MSKTPAKNEPQSDNGPKAAVEALCDIVERALAFRNDSRPTLTTVAKLANRGSGLLKLADVDLKISVENVATVALAKKLNLVS